MNRMIILTSYVSIRREKGRRERERVGQEFPLPNRLLDVERRDQREIRSPFPLYLSLPYILFHHSLPLVLPFLAPFPSPRVLLSFQPPYVVCNKIFFARKNSKCERGNTEKDEMRDGRGKNSRFVQFSSEESTSIFSFLSYSAH